MMDLISRPEVMEKLEDIKKKVKETYPWRGEAEPIMVDIRLVEKMVDEMPSAYKVPLTLTEEEKKKLREMFG